MDTNAVPSTSDSKLSSSSETGRDLVNLKLKSASDDVSNSNNDFTKTPSCVVCGDEASGRHYRAMTCEGCKTFFRRNAARRDLLKCDMDEAGDCVINRFLRRHCAYCRMQKCLKAGMQVDRVWDKERVKTRKRIDKKPKCKQKAASLIPNASSPAEDQLEGITPEMQELLDSIQGAFDQATHQLLVLTPRPSPHKECMIHTSSTESQPTQKTHENDNSNHGNQNTDISTTTTCIDCKLDKHSTDENVNIKRKTVADDSSNVKCACALRQHGESESRNSGEEMGDRDKLCKCCAVTGIKDGDRVLTPECMNSVDRGSSKSGSCHNFQGTSDLPSSSSSSSQSVLRQDTQESSLLSLSTPEVKVHGNTPLVNVDKTITSYIMEMSLLSLRHMIAFAKLLPIFTTLSWESQAALIKGAFVEYIVLGALSQFDLENQRVKSFFNPGTTVYERKTLEKAGLGNAFNQVLGMAEKFCGLQLNKKEEAMLFALSILSPDRPGIDAAAKTAVSNIQEELADVLRVSLQSKNREVKFCFPKAMMLLTDLRNATETYRSDVMQVELHANVITPLLAELFDM